jgi:hypothetical protein
MGEVELIPERQLLLVRSVIILYGHAASTELANTVALDIAECWNAAQGKQRIGKILYDIQFIIDGVCNQQLTPIEIYENTNPKNNYFRVENFVNGDISFVDEIGSNTGYFKHDNLLNQSSTAAHEYGHSLGLAHPKHLDIRGKGIPGIMYPRGTLVDPAFQYYPEVMAGQKGGTLNPAKRKVLQEDLADLHVDDLKFNQLNKAILGEFTSVWHDAHLP